MKKNQNAKDMIFLLATGLVTVVAWAGFDIYRAYTKVTPPAGVEELLTPLSPQLDADVLISLEQRTP